MSDELSPSRRNFLKSSAALLSGGALIDATTSKARAQENSRIEIENGSLTVASDPSDLASRNYLTAFATDDRKITNLPHEFSGYTPEGDRLGYRGTEQHSYLTGSGWEAINTQRTFVFDENSAVSITHQLNLPPENPILIIETEFENKTDSQITINRPDSHITEGVMLTRTPPLYSPQGTYRYYVDGHSVEAFADSDLWLPYQMDDSQRFITHFGSEAAVTTSYLDGRTEPIMGKTRTTEEVDNQTGLPHSEENPPARQTIGFDVDCLDLCVDGFTLEPGESAEYAVAVSTHDGGENAVASARERTETAEALWNGMPNLTHSTVQSDSEGVLPSVGQMSQVTMIVVGGGVVGAGMYAWQRSQRSDDETEPTESSNSETDTTSHSTANSTLEDGTNSVTELREQASESIDRAERAVEYTDYEMARDSYEEAIAYLKKATAESTDPDTEAKIKTKLKETQTAIKTATTRREQRDSLVTTLQAAEQSFKEATARYAAGNQTVARIRFRQARDAFDEAKQTIAENDTETLAHPIAVNFEEEATLPSMALEDLTTVDESTVETLAAVDVESIADLEIKPDKLTPAVVSDLQQSDELTEEEASLLTILSWWYEGDSREFASEEVLSRRYEQSEHGFDQST